MSQGQPLRALISTIEPIDGGVPTMTRCLSGLLEELGIEPVYGWYAPWSNHPDLSTPLPAVLRGRRPSQQRRMAYGDHEAHGLGSWLPELEFTHYLPRRAWRELIGSCQLHLAVTGNALSALPFAQLGLPFLAWVATPWEADRSNRVRGFNLPRRLLDRQLNSRVLRHLERRVLRAPAGRVLALSPYTAAALGAIAQRPMAGVLLMPIDPSVFHPDPTAVVPWRLGFAGRFGDPRKNVNLLLEATQRLSLQGLPVELHLAGERDLSTVQSRIRELGIEALVHGHGPLAPGPLAQLLRSLDVFVIPSHQEGLCIAGLEAMACGAPVVSTRCGGPEHFVIDDRTGQLVASDPTALAGAIATIASDRARRQRLASGALDWVRANASPEAARGIVRQQLAQLWPQVPLPGGEAG
jgi:glycosyltransferase involved in cell wall biosynthesis